MRIGVLGGGQLGRMLALAAYPLGHACTFLEPAPEATCEIGNVIAAPFDDGPALEALAAASDVVTYEFENVPVASVRHLAERVAVWPPPAALEVAQDRLVEKRFFQACGIATAPFAAADDRASLEQAVRTVGLPAVVKTRRLGYDGKGQVVVRTLDEVDAAWGALAPASLVVEGFVRFARELSILAVRGRDGACAAWPLVETLHTGGILRRALAPAAGVTPAAQAAAEAHVRHVLERLGYVGVVALELFEVDAGLVANEMAPRVHNSGHWTIEGAETSQFENHLRAIVGAPLGATAPLGAAAMVNLVGVLPPDDAVLALPGAHLHRYGKAPRPGRKVGHVTLRAPDADALAPRLRALEALVAAASCPDQ